MKVLLINPYIPDYRLHFFKLLGEKMDLTIAHSGKIKNDQNLNFQEKVFSQKRIGPFSYYAENLHKLCKQYDIVISEGNIRYLDRDILILNPFRKYKWISWGIGVSASYNKKFDQDKRFDFIRNFIFKRADAQVFYSDYPLKKHVNAGFKPASLFVANNTTLVSYNQNKKFKKYKLLLVGTLYKQKKINELLDAYLQYSKLSTNCLPLEIIGDGEEYENISKWIQNNQLNDKIKLHGAIFNHEILEQHFRESYACISPGQAGLSVLSSMGYGTPYICKIDAITGGEIFNIKDRVNGVLYNKVDELINIIQDIEINPSKYIKMGNVARDYYLNHRKPEQMVQGFLNACFYVLKQLKVKQ